MTFSSWRQPVRRVAGLALCLAALGAVGPLAAAPAAADPLVVVLDQARLLRLPENVATIVVGNPLIADVSVQTGGMMVITGKGYGLTNLVALDRAGKVLMDEAVQVEGPPDAVVVYRGVNRESYSCTPFCERRITLGDTPDFFQSTLAQTGSRSQQAVQGGAAAAGTSR
ncbi:putative secretin RcpA/CpaC, associated with Flp pilus assembly [Rhodovulum sp. PH10]|uniref:pilus assembly protein N-terminal domain-containing protein n=1 Tax=Rhodovulum sp. PH10 TaxID=1187851 RepID=UPI00027C1E60|nr:pilus assembly protein N-terminal domain-containing protein [Rhodovulum sp. PH10]EJW10943.1 putative secretin RcpA/CpaC, associated with Flp pilus assembly [Rhodovulum sp. PH10]